jgi:hypothetical protein
LIARNTINPLSSWGRIEWSHEQTATSLRTVHTKGDMIHDVRFEGAEVCEGESESAEGKSRANLRVLPPFIVDEVLEDALLIGGVLRPHL